MNKTNTLKLVVGCMFSGKSTYLINEFSRYSVITDDIIMVNHSFDKKRRSIRIENGIGKIVSHNEKSCPAYMLSNISEIKNISSYKNSEVVIIDEGQFYSDLYEFLEEELKKDFKIKKNYIVGGLSNNYNMESMGDMAKLIPLADKIEHLNAFCIYCKDRTTASFTKRLIYDDSDVLVGKEDIYSPVCRYHYYN